MTRSPAHDYFEKHKDTYVDQLKKLAAIASISSSDTHMREVYLCAEAVETLMRNMGLEKVELLEVDGALPYIYGEWIKAAGAPTVLLYAHYDVQPIGDEKLWHSPAFTPEIRGERLYGRGTADDKAGIMAHLAAIDSYLKADGSLPVNIKCIFEGEEEIGSLNLEKLLAKYAHKLQADYIIIADTENFAEGIGGITTQLRGLIDLDIELRALTQPVHSGQYGGPVPDPVMELTKLLAKLVDKKGKIAVPGVYADVRMLSPKERAALKRLPFNEKRFREHAKMLPTSKVSGEKGFTPYELIWHRPALSINAIQASSRAQVSNIIVDAAWAHLGIRLVPNMSPKKTMAQLVRFLKKEAPKNMLLTITPGHAVPWWTSDTKSPPAQAALRALKKGFGKDPVSMGSGASIGFVEPFARALGGAPALLLGVEDPESNAHSYNESLYLPNWYKTVDSMMHLYEELARI